MCVLLERGGGGEGAREREQGKEEECIEERERERVFCVEM